MSEVIEDIIIKWIQAGAPVEDYFADESAIDTEEVKGYIPESLKLQFKALCIQKRVMMRSVLHDLIDEWVQTKKGL